ncbi:MAG: hypothetical protein H3C34_24495, partial [Caldilineaceae bacterium]|nr:hypothetical protein [Caldilineaceae bacterium]
MIRKWSNRRLNVRRIVTSSVLLALVVAALLAGAQAVQAETAAIRCATFDDLTVGTSYAVGAKFSAGLEFEVLPYTWADGTVTNSGTIAVSNGLFAAGSGNELTVNNATLGLLLPSPSGVVGLTLRFGEYGGNVNVTINGDFRNIDNLSVLDGLTVGGAAVSVTGGLGNDAGELKVAGPISSFSIGGQEFFVDDLCLLKGEQEGPVDPQHPDHRPDLGDAPDSTNHAGKPNTAYPATGTLGHFPTVWDGTPAGAGTGPKHINPQLEGVLGKGLTAEADADPPAADADLINNILAGGDNANNDRLDDGWRNPGAPMPNCREATLTVRVWRGPAAALSRMYLNVWFDGNRDGDWEDTGECQRTDNTGPVARSFEWIVQDFAVNMGAIPKGGYVDIPVNTLLVMNVDGEHDEGLQWMRFTLSEAPAIANPATSLADGRGPDAPNAFQYGE